MPFSLQVDRRGEPRGTRAHDGRVVEFVLGHGVELKQFPKLGVRRIRVRCAIDQDGRNDALPVVDALDLLGGPVEFVHVDVLKIDLLLLEK